MTISAGTRLGPYEIVDSIGAGGMGEVWRAKDTRLDRDVAIKVTKEGTILGTFQYMAPEQLEGLEADARTDIFGFGAVLYEMATGNRAFQGSTRTSLIAAIVSGEPQPTVSCSH